MRVTQTISIGTLRINSMSNSSIVQIGTSGAMKARSEEITEQVTPSQADKAVENKITKEIKPMLKKEGLPVEPPTPQQQAGGTQADTGQPGGTSQQASNGSGATNGSGTMNGSRRQKST
jgi:spore germination protein PB